MSAKPIISEAEAIRMFAECFDVPAESLTPNTARSAVPGWDSMGALMLMAELDERFSLELTAEVSRAMKTVDDALALLRQHGIVRAGA